MNTAVIRPSMAVLILGFLACAMAPGACNRQIVEQKETPPPLAQEPARPTSTGTDESAVDPPSPPIEERKHFKAFLDERYDGYDVQMWINGVDMGLKDARMSQNIRFLNTDNPLKAELANAPDFVKDDFKFVIREGKNTIRVTWKKAESNVSPQYVQIILRPVGYPAPLFFLYADGDRPGDVEKTVDVSFTPSDTFQTVVGRTGPGFIHFTGATKGTRVSLNGEVVEATGGKGDHTSVLRSLSSLPTEGSNEILVEYETETSRPVTYLIVTPGLEKRVSTTDVGKHSDVHTFTRP